MSKHLLMSYCDEMFYECLLQDVPSDVIILFPGFPSSNNLKEKIRFFYDLGFHVFAPRYPGSYQSDGVFLEDNPVEKYVSFIDSLSGSVNNLWDLKNYSYVAKKIFLVGESFAGPIICGICASSSSISKAILFSPVLDYETHNQNGDEEDLVQLTSFVKRAYKHLYRYDFDNMVVELSKFPELSSSFYLSKITTSVLIFQDSSDPVVSVTHSKQLDSPFELVISEFGHGMSLASLTIFEEKIKRFLI